MHSPMWERRPDWLKAEIDEKFAQVSAEIPRGYGRHGTNPNYQIGPTTIRDLADYHSTQLDRPLRILEVGCGAGHLILHKKFKDIVHGVTAYDYQRAGYSTPAVENGNYLIGNAEYLHRLGGLLPSYDIVLSLYTVQHLVDKVGSIEQMADRVAPGGWLGLDRFVPYENFAPLDNIRPSNRVPKLGMYAPEVLDLLLQSGFSPLDLSEIAQHQLPELEGEGQIVLRRDSDMPIRFGLGYAAVQAMPEEMLWIDTWRYTLPGELMT